MAARQNGTATEVPGSRKGGGNVSTGDAYEERKYQVYFFDTTANTIDARNANGVPAYGDQLGTYDLYRVDKSAEIDANEPRRWTVTIQYRTPQPYQPTPQPDPDTHIWNVFKSINPVPVEVPVQNDYVGKPCVNCLNEPIQPPIVIQVYDLEIDISFMTDVPDQEAIQACLGRTNTAQVRMAIAGVAWFFEAGTLLFDRNTVAEVAREDGGKNAQMSYKLVHRFAGWLDDRPNLSYHKKVSGKVVSIKDDEGQPVSEPRYLDAAGVEIPAGSSIVLNHFQNRMTADFDPLLDGIRLV